MNINTFLKSESGAVTTDYVFWITASVRSTMTMVAVSDGVETLADRIATDLSSGTIVFTSFKGLASEDRVLSSTRLRLMMVAKARGRATTPTPRVIPAGRRATWGNGDRRAIPGRTAMPRTADERLSRRTTASAASVILPYRR
jgi:hypothetical protein